MAHQVAAAKEAETGMVRMHVALEESLHERLREEAARRGLSMAALVRELVRERLPSPLRQERDFPKLEAFIGSGRGSASDVSVHHDDYLAGKRK